MPKFERHLAGHDRGAAAIAVFQDLLQIMTGPGIERLESPIVQDQQLRRDS
jgi:hypothetical protein